MPEEYVKTMRESMLNRCPVSSYDQVCDVIKKELGGAPDEVCKYCPFSPHTFVTGKLLNIFFLEFMCCFYTLSPVTKIFVILCWDNKG